MCQGVEKDTKTAKRITNILRGKNFLNNLFDYMILSKVLKDEPKRVLCEHTYMHLKSLIKLNIINDVEINGYDFWNLYEKILDEVIWEDDCANW